MAELPKYICFRVAPNDLEVYIKRVEPEEVAEDLRPVVRGHWELLTWAFDYYRCSECGFEQRLEEFPYCPNCGADMCPE